MSEHGDTVADSEDGHPDEAYCSACNRSYAPEVERCPNDGTRLVRFKAQRDEMVGRVLDDRFEVGLPLGRGGMGTVYRAIQVSVDREIAIKVVHPKLANDRQAAKRFLREARLASRLNQPNIVNVIDFGQTEDGVLYLAMELLRGRTLATELAGHRRFAVRRTVNIALQLCDALEAAHAQGIIHRDLKPQNIVVLDDPPGRDLIKVLDFGLAKSLVTDTTSQVTNTDAIIGTPLYMSPEQVEGKPTDQRSDLYSLGCILFELLAGAPPFQDASANLLLSKHVSAPPPPLPSHVPAPIRTVIERVLAKRPEDRLQTAGDVRTALQNAIDGGVLGAREPADTVPDAPSHDPALAMTQPPPEAPGSATGTASHAAAARSTTPPPLATAHGRSRRGAALVGAAALALASVAIGYQVVTRSREVPAPGAGSGSVVVVDSGALDPPTSPDAAPAAAPIDAPVVEPPPATVDARANERGRDRDRDRVRDRGNDGVRANWYGGDARVEAPAPDAVPARQSTPSPDAKPEIDFVRRKKPDARP